MGKEDVEYMHVHTHINTNTHTHTEEYYSAMERNEFLPCATIWIDLKGIILSAISQTEKDTYCMISLIFRI